ncbi:MAG: cobaltochelatase CobT-related protein [Parashewanella sp.]
MIADNIEHLANDLSDETYTALLNSFNYSLVHERVNFKQLRYHNFKLFADIGQLPFHAPHLQNYWQDTDNMSDSDIESISKRPDRKGQIDAIAMRLAFSDLTAHLAVKPQSDIAALVFEMLEQFRVESITPDHFKGIRLNTDHLFIHWAKSFYYSGLTESSLGILLFTLAQMCRSRLFAQPVLAETEDLIEHTRVGLASAIGKQLAGMRRNRNDQTVFAVFALETAQTIEAMIEQECTADGTDNEVNELEKVVKGFSILLNQDIEETNNVSKAKTGNSRVFEQAEQKYRIFSTEFDRIITPADRIRPELLKEYRQQLDAEIIKRKINITALIRQITRNLSQSTPEGRLSELDEGLIDGTKLTSVISSPSDRSIFYQVGSKPKVDAHISILVDCSGSMKGLIKPISTLLDVLVRSFDKAGSSTELLGFTTGEWNGGQVVRKWRRQRCPENPGRLNSTCHMIFKAHNKSWQRSRLSMAAMLKADLFREGIDGEAINWACQRMEQVEAGRKVLVVISDGSPMDNATNLANDQFYLDNHLKQVVLTQQQQGIEIVGLGVGIDLSPYYSKNLGIDLEKFDITLLRSVIDLITSRK